VGVQRGALPRCGQRISRHALTLRATHFASSRALSINSSGPRDESSLCMPHAVGNAIEPCDTEDNDNETACTVAMCGVTISHAVCAARLGHLTLHSRQDGHPA
jgi:hypothetical protein